MFSRTYPNLKISKNTTLGLDIANYQHLFQLVIYWLKICIRLNINPKVSTYDY